MKNCQSPPCRVLPPPEVLIARAHEKVKDGELVDEQTRQYVARALARFADWIGQGA